MSQSEFERTISWRYESKIDCFGGFLRNQGKHIDQNIYYKTASTNHRKTYDFYQEIINRNSELLEDMIHGPDFMELLKSSKYCFYVNYVVKWHKLLFGYVLSYAALWNWDLDIHVYRLVSIPQEKGEAKQISAQACVFKLVTV